ncbi:hypothetical protein GBA52_021765 [Prunus armeniaca]|nr:hypothetical protein GBA52_021765 [Prunus armeniaca]
MYFRRRAPAVSLQLLLPLVLAVRKNIGTIRHSRGHSDHERNEVGNEYRPDYLAGQNDPCPKPRGLRVRPIL